MGKRQLVFCDLSKEEVGEDEELITIVIKHKGKSSRSYEISSKTAGKLEQQLVAGMDAALGTDWSFGRGESVTVIAKDGSKKTLADLEYEEQEDDTKFVAEKKNSLREEGVDFDQRPEPTEEKFVAALGVNAPDQCSHRTKTRIQTTIRKKKRYAYRNCKDCGKEIPEKSSKDRQGYMNAELPSDTNLRDL